MLTPSLARFPLCRLAVRVPGSQRLPWPEWRLLEQGPWLPHLSLNGDQIRECCNPRCCCADRQIILCPRLLGLVERDPFDPCPGPSGKWGVRIRCLVEQERGGKSPVSWSGGGGNFPLVFQCAALSAWDVCCVWDLVKEITFRGLMVGTGACKGWSGSVVKCD